jgi:alpha-beta hydrolase superfamily lysophospholipase
MWGRRRWLKWGLSLTAGAVAVGGGLTWWAATELVAPGRRTLQAYHREFLEDPQAHGVMVRRFELTDGTPCFLVEPAAGLALGKRGQRLRDQLQGQGLALRPVGDCTGTLVLLHGRKGRKEDYLLIAERFCAAGFRCVIPDLPGHGEHPASAVGFGLLEGALPEKALAEAAERFGFDAKPAGLMGMSMGGSVAMHAAARANSPWKALVILSSFDALQPVVAQQAVNRAGTWLGGLWATSAGWLYESETGLALGSINSAALAKQVTMPTLVAHGTADRVIPLEAGRRLYEALPEALEKKWVEIPGADHDNVLVTDFPIYAAMAEWMVRHVSEKR